MSDRARMPAPNRASESAKAARLYGDHPVRAAWLNPVRRCRRLVGTPAALAAFAPTLDAAAAARLPRPTPEPTDRRAVDQLLPEGAVHQGLMLEADPLPDPGLDAVLAGLAQDQQAILVVLDQITDPHNVGAILRSAAAFGAAGMMMTERHAPPVTGALARSASGAVEAVPILRVVNLARTLRQLADDNFLCVGLSEDAATALPDVPRAPRTALVIGAEGAGLRRLTRDTCQVLARLPTTGPLATLNASNAAAIALYELTAHPNPAP